MQIYGDPFKFGQFITDRQRISPILYDVMCMFSGKIKEVSNTRIFARMVAPARQGLVYAMNVDTPTEVAMVLPLPVVVGSAEDAVKFIDLSKFPHFFTSLDKGFPASAGGDPFANSPTRSAPKSVPLKVHQVGSFEASFVPKMADFSRLDERFRLPEGALEKIGIYKDYGFAVFKFKAGNQKVHPMAMTFPSRFADRLYFPTVHIHDGEVHEKEEFDHNLYAQCATSGGRALLSWEESSGNAVVFSQAGLSEGLIDPAKHVYRLSLKGELKNEDQFLMSV